MSTSNYSSDLHTSQVAAKDNSALLIQDGALLTGNVQSATARWTRPAGLVYPSGDIVNVVVVELPTGALILPGLSSIQYASSPTAIGVKVHVGDDTETMLDGSTSSHVYPQVFAATSAKITTPTKVTVKLTLTGDLPADWNFQITIAYATAA
jgi:hypothetical protein